MNVFIPSLLSVIITAHPLVNEDVVEPSVCNEIEHALSRVPTNHVARAMARAQASLTLTNTITTDNTQPSPTSISTLTSANAHASTASVNALTSDSSLAITREQTVVKLPFPTNGLTRTELAIRLVSTQRADGRWLVGTNDVTAVAVKLLTEMFE